MSSDLRGHELQARQDTNASEGTRYGRTQPPKCATELRIPANLVPENDHVVLIARTLPKRAKNRENVPQQGNPLF
jgi:hypothetical protein